MLSVIAAPVCWLRGARLVNWLQDMFPETAEVLGTGGRLTKIPYSVMRWLRTKSLKVAGMNVALGDRMAARVVALGVPRERVAIINNWADNTIIQSIGHSANHLRAEWGLHGKFVVGYSGNLGRAHDVDTVLQAIGIIENAAGVASHNDTMGEEAISGIAWLFIGSGARFATLKTEAARCKFTSVTFKPYQSQSRLAESLSASDVHLVSLRPELEGLIVPSKFYGIAAAGRPTIFIGDKSGEIARLVKRYGCGRTVATGDGVGLARTILDLAGRPALCRRMGERARHASEGDLDRSIAIARWEAVLTDVSGGTPKSYCHTTSLRGAAVCARGRGRR
jgi:glycosyltransferase involved in cell wall biosynthesis